MAYDDWAERLVIPGLAAASDEVFNVSLSDPLDETDGYIGGYARRIQELSTSPYRAIYNIRPALDSGAWVGSTISDAISIRAWLRSEGGGTVTNLNHGGVGIRTKGSADDGYDGYGYILYLGDGDGYAQGFGVSGDGYGSAPSHVFSLTLALLDESSTNYIYLRNELGTGVADSTKVDRNMWYRVRMDVIPFGNKRDTINIYVANPPVSTGLETWTLIHTEEVFDTSPGFRGQSASHTNGWISAAIDNTNPNISNYIDSFEIRKASV